MVLSRRKLLRICIVLILGDIFCECKSLLKPTKVKVSFLGKER